jgi:hypothetical protein|tara:strand:- start:188 stop:370 length:183 start_codon:yes stop_codon:yes gene_type:complete
MNKLYVFGGVIVLDILLPVVMNFLSIDSASYINYLTWINALVIFYLLLPTKLGNIFYIEN